MSAADGGACYVYGRRVADEHQWDEAPVHARILWLHGAGPLCLCCGLPKGTWQWEMYADRHRARVGHGLETGACTERCQTEPDGGRSRNKGIHWWVLTRDDGQEWSVGEWAYGVWFPADLDTALREADRYDGPAFVVGRNVA